MSPAEYDDGRVQLHHGDCLDVLRAMPDASVHAVVTDPPYGLSDHKPEHVTAALIAWISGDREHVPAGKTGFMNRAWDGFVPPPAVWDECLRVLRPGGHLLCFAAPRTMDLMGLSIRLAGFEIRDGIGTALPSLMAWNYGSGMPKGINVGKAIDKIRDWTLVERLAGEIKRARAEAGLSLAQIGQAMQAVTDGQYGVWYHRGGHMFFETGRSLPSRPEWEHLRTVLPIAAEFVEVYEAAEREVLVERTMTQGGGSALNLRMGEAREVRADITAPATPEAAQWEGWNTSLRPSWEPIIVARRPFPGTVAANVMEHGAGALNVDATRVGMSEDDRKATTRNGVYGETTPGSVGFTKTAMRTPINASGRWPANVVLVHAEPEGEPCQDGCPVAEMDRQSGITKDGVAVQRNGGGQKIGGQGIYSGSAGLTRDDQGYGDSGGASRFFPTFKYQAKAPARERPRVNGVAHVSVKPLELMKWLVRLVTPPGGTILDPFAGSGTTLEAGILEGFRVIGVEREPDYLPLIELRIERAHQAIAERVEAAEKAKRPAPARTKPKRNPAPAPAVDPSTQDMLPFEVA